MSRKRDEIWVNHDEDGDGTGGGMSAEEARQLKDVIRRSEIEAQNQAYEETKLQDLLKASEKEAQEHQERLEREAEERRIRKYEKTLNAISKSPWIDRECDSQREAISIRLKFPDNSFADRKFSEEDKCSRLLQWAALETRTHGKLCLPRQLTLKSVPQLRICVSGNNRIDRDKSLKEMKFPRAIALYISP